MTAAIDSPQRDLPASVDALVIGAGHNGLVAAGYLARSGLSVAVLEASDAPGGMTASGTLIPGAPGHVVNSCAVDIISMLHSQIFRDLELRRFGLEIVKPDPGYLSLHPDGASLALWRDPRRTAQEIEAFSRRDAAAFLEFIELLDALIATVLPAMGLDFGRPSPRALWASARAALRHRRLLPEILALLTGSAASAVDERFEHPVVRGAILNLAAGAGPVDRPGGGLGYLLLALLSRVGVGRPIGGMQALTTALVAGLEERGGRVITGAPVAEILHAQGRVRGARLADGRTLESKVVVASCDPAVTLLELIDRETVGRKLAARIEHVPANGTGAGPFKIDMALRSRIAAVAHRRDDDVGVRVPTLLIGTAESVRESYATAARGEVPDDPALWVVSPSGADPSQAPEGQESLYIYDVAEPVAPAAGRDAARELAVERILTKLGAYIAPLKEAEIGRVVETPSDLGERLRVRGGCVTHVDMGLLRAGPLRPVVGLGTGKTPLQGLLLGGSGTHPGGGVTGLPGRTAAERAQRYLKKSS